MQLRMLPRVTAVPYSSIQTTVREDEFVHDQLLHGSLRLRHRNPHTSLGQPPLADPFERVLRLGVLGEIAQDLTRNRAQST